MRTLIVRGRVMPVAGLLVPLGVCAVLVPFRTSFANTDAALVLVAVVVALAALGSRLGGFLAAVSSAVWFDFFLTRPYEHFSITSRTDIQTTVLLAGIGIAVSELAVWGHKHQRAAARQAGYLTGLHSAAESMAAGGPPTRMVNDVSDQLVELLGLRRCRFSYGSGIGNPRLEHDGRLTWHGEVWNIDGVWPAEPETELVVSSPAGFHGRFLMTPAPDVRPTIAERLVAVSLADQVGAAIGGYVPELR